MDQKIGIKFFTPGPSGTIYKLISLLYQKIFFSPTSFSDTILTFCYNTLAHQSQVQILQWSVVLTQKEVVSSWDVHFYGTFVFKNKLV